MEPTDAEAVLAYDDLSIDPVRREVRRAGDLLHLTVREFDLLVFLTRHPDRPFTRMQLLDKVWDIQYEGYDHTIDSHVQRLRAKVDFASARRPSAALHHSVDSAHRRNRPRRRARSRGRRLREQALQLARVGGARTLGAQAAAH